MRDADLSVAIHYVISYHKCVALQILVHRRSNGRRVFKEMCLSGQIPDNSFSRSTRCLEPDLCFSMALSLHVWPRVLELYDCSEIKRRSRRLAIKSAVRAGLWDHVISMVTSKFSRAGDSRYAFCEALRRERPDVAYQLCEKGLCKRTCLLVKATEWCLRLKQLSLCCKFVRLFSTFELKIPLNLMHSVLNANRDVDGWTDNLHLLVDEQHTGKDKDLLSYLMDASIWFGNYHSVECLVDSSTQSPYGHRVYEIALKAAMHNRANVLFRSLLSRHPAIVTSKQFSAHFKISMKRYRIAWHVIAPFLEEYLRKGTYDDEFLQKLFLSLEKLKLDEKVVDTIAQWNYDQSLHHLAFVFSLMRSNWNLMRLILQHYEYTLDAALLRSGCIHIFRSLVEENVDESLDAVVLIVNRVPGVDWLASVFDKADKVSHRHKRKLLSKCTETGMLNWALFFACESDEWDYLEQRIQNCFDRGTLDSIITKAAKNNRWHLVDDLVNRCSPDALIEPLRDAVHVGKTHSLRLMLPKVDPLCCNISLLGLADHNNVETEYEEIMVLLIQAGLSTHEQRLSWQDLATSRGILENMLPHSRLALIKLMHVSGAFSNAELRCCIEDKHLLTYFWEPDTEFEREDVWQYLRHAAETPHSLMNLCRMSISHAVGCHPGRTHRLQALPLPPMLKDFMRYEIERRPASPPFVPRWPLQS